MRSFKSNYIFLLFSSTENNNSRTRQNKQKKFIEQEKELNSKSNIFLIFSSSLENLENPIGQKSEDKSKENKTDSLSQTSNHNNKTPKKSNITLGRKASSEALRRSPREKIISEEDKNENTRARRSGGSLVKERIAKFESVCLIKNRVDSTHTTTFSFLTDSRWLLFYVV
jgi:hypothetical protein